MEQAEDGKDMTSSVSSSDYYDQCLEILRGLRQVIDLTCKEWTLEALVDLGSRLREIELIVASEKSKKYEQRASQSSSPKATSSER